MGGLTQGRNSLYGGEMQKHQFYKGKKFTRDDRTGYYLSSTLGARIHRFVYEDHHGKIPEGWHVHHKDRDRANNAIENLEAMPAGDHQALHWAEDRTPEKLAKARRNMAIASEAAKAWHKSPEGRAWHRAHALRVAAKQKPKAATCEQCGGGYESKLPRRFCSNACRSAARRASGVDIVIGECCECGGPFQFDKNRVARTCSRSCRARLAYRNRK